MARLPVYRRVLLELLSTRTTTVSSTRLATLAGVNAAKVRKDLSYLAHSASAAWATTSSICSTR